MKLRNTFKQMICVCLMFSLSFCIPFSAMASSYANSTAFEQSLIQGNSSDIMPLGSGSGSFTYPTSTRVSIVAGSVDTVTYQGIHSGGSSNDGVIILRFTNTSTGDFKSWTFICDGTSHTDSLPYSLPAGTYNVTMTDCTVGNFSRIFVTFK